MIHQAVRIHFRVLPQLLFIALASLSHDLSSFVLPFVPHLWTFFPSVLPFIPQRKPPIYGERRSQPSTLTFVTTIFFSSDTFVEGLIGGLVRSLGWLCACHTHKGHGSLSNPLLQSFTFLHHIRTCINAVLHAQPKKKLVHLVLQDSFVDSTLDKQNP